jgi:hypothetical protein
MASEFPECEFLGIDIVPLQPTTILPKNCSFELANVLEGSCKIQAMSMLFVNHPLVIGIPKPDNLFDYIHHRFLIGAIPTDKWKQHIQECARVCASDGWVEIVEPNAQLFGGGPACQQFDAWFIKGFKARGIDVNIVQDLDKLMREAGLINVTKQIVTVPVGPWGGKAGEFFAEDFRLLNLSLQPLFTNALGVPKEDVEKNGALMIEEFKSCQVYIHMYIYLGQKR